jgi:signal transduction histidine kinase/CheY-like chemotaxis protein
MEIDFQKEICIKQFIINCGTIALQFNQSLEIIWESVEFKRNFSDNSLTIQDYFILNNSLEQALQLIKNGKKIRGHMLKGHSSKYYYMSTLMIVPNGRHFCSLRKLGEPMGTINYFEIIEKLQIDLATADEFSSNSFKFLANMSHEIRTPINGIVGMLSLVNDTLLNEKQMDYIETARDCCNNLLGIVNDVLDFTKLEANKVQIKREKFYLRECVDSSISVVNYKANQKGLSINLKIEKEVPTYVISDFKRLRQILINLLSNAVKFTNSGYIYITIRATNIESDIFDIVFNVRDTGIGIKQEHIEKIFTNYGQSDNNCACGTGLGLAICSRLCTLLNGKISCISVLGKGSTFKFNIQEKGRSDKINTNSLPKVQKLIGKKMLIVDDNEINRLLLMTTILKWSAQIIPICCSSGEEALRYIKQMDFDIGLIDILMPNMDGFELAKEIQKSTKNFPLIALSSLNEDDILAKCDTKLFEHILYKPVNEKRLLKLCSSLFDKTHNVIHRHKKKIKQAKFAKVIIAEDILENQKVLEGYLNNFGYTDITICENGLQALDKIRETEYDILFLDIKMPIMDGVELAKLLHKSTSINKIPYIIALTANVMGKDKFYYLNKCNMDNYLTKPIDRNKLHEMLQIFHNPVHVV